SPAPKRPSSDPLKVFLGSRRPASATRRIVSDIPGIPGSGVARLAAPVDSAGSYRAASPGAAESRPPAILPAPDLDCSDTCKSPREFFAVLDGKTLLQLLFYAKW